MNQSVDFQDFIDEVIQKNDIVDLISRYVTLKRVGNRFQALCPLHNDKKTPSFSVSPDKQLFHCFGCGAGGTVINFIMAKENLDFMEALKLLADRARIPMPETRSVQQRNEMAKIHDKKQRMYKMNADAGKFFYSCLTSPKYSYALEYLNKRNIPIKTINSFGLGYAPDSWNALLNHLKSLGYTENEVLECGLCVKRDSDGSYYDKFRDRVMFPIIDLRGNVIGFGGRIINDKNGDAAKYLNSPETLIFKKKENLFAMNFAKNSKEDRILIMEGYMDVISLHQKGFTNAVASLGTAFTSEQAQIIKKYKGRAVLCYDADEAGQKAALRAGGILSDAGIKTKVLTVTDAKDPDEYINLKGAEMFKSLVENAVNLVEYRISKIEKQYNLDDGSEKIEFIDKVASVFAEIKEPVEREIYMKEFSRKYDISIPSVEAHIDKYKKKNETAIKRREESIERRAFEKRTGGRRDLGNMRLFNAEQLLLNLISEKEVFNALKDKLLPEDFSEGLHRKLAEIIFKIHMEGKTVIPTSVLSEFSSEEMPEAAKILSDDKNVDDKKRAAKEALEIVKQTQNRKAEQVLAENGDIDSLKEIINQLKKDKS